MMPKTLLVTVALLLLASGMMIAADAPPRAALGDRSMRGLVQPSKQVVLNAPMSGRLAEVLVDEGQDVKAEDVLARMDDRLQRVAAEAARLKADAEADVRRAQFTREHAKLMLERIQQAHAAQAANDWEVRRTELEFEQAKAAYEATLEAKGLAAVESRLEEERLALYAIRAPFDGRIIRTPAEPGVSLQPDQPVVALAMLDPLEAVVFLPIDLYGKLTIGQTYDLQAGKPVNRVIQGKLKTIDPVIESGSRTFRCVFTITNPGSELPAGFEVFLVPPTTQADAQ